MRKKELLMVEEYVNICIHGNATPTKFVFSYIVLLVTCKWFGLPVKMAARILSAAYFR